MNALRTLKTGLVLIALVAASGVFANSWMTNGPKRNVVTLVVTGNYKSPRLMAELILYESRQPYLLFPAPESKDQRIIYVQAKGPAYEIPEKSLPQFVQFLNPKRIVALGDERYIQPKSLKLFDRNIPLVRIEGNDWNLIAEQTTLLLGLSNLAGDYVKLREEMMNKARLLRPTPRTGQDMQIKPLENAPAASDDIALTEVDIVEVTEPAPVAQ